MINIRKKSYIFIQFCSIDKKGGESNSFFLMLIKHLKKGKVVMQKDIKLTYGNN